MKDQNLTSENFPHGVPGCTRELELKSQPATFADIVAAIGLLGIATTLCIANMPCHAGELSFPLSWQHAQRFQFANLSTWVAPTVQWPYTALIVLSRNLTSSPLLLPKVAALLAFATTLGLIRAIPSERCSCLGSRLAATLFFVQYLPQLCYQAMTLSRVWRRRSPFTCYLTHNSRVLFWPASP